MYARQLFHEREAEQNWSKKVVCFWCCLSVHLEPIMAAKQAWQLQQCSLGYRTPSDDDSDESVCSLPSGLHEIHPTGKQVWVTQTKHTPSLKHTHTHTHWFKHALPAVCTARCIININWPHFIVTNTFHMVWASWRPCWICTPTIKAAKSLYSGVKNHRILSSGHLL